MPKYCALNINGLRNRCSFFTAQGYAKYYCGAGRRRGIRKGKQLLGGGYRFKVDAEKSDLLLEVLAVDVEQAVGMVEAA